MKDYSDLEYFCKKNNFPLTTKIAIAYRKTSLGEVIYLDLCNSNGSIVATNDINMLNVKYAIDIVKDLLNETKDKFKDIYISFHIDGFYYGSSPSHGNVVNFLFQDETIIFDMLMI
jgi:hypothetical protein